MNQNQLEVALQQQCLLTGSFVLRSGAVATSYFDKYKFEADPSLLREVARALAPLVPPGTEVLAGLEMGGIPVVTALSLECGIPAAFVRKTAKAYGTAKLAEGADIVGKQVLIVEDVITTGGQVAISARDMRELGATIDQALCVLDRSGGTVPALQDANVELISLFQADLTQS